MKVRDIQKRRYRKAIPVVLKQYGPKCPSFHPKCIVCQGHRLLRIFRRIPAFEETNPLTY